MFLWDIQSDMKHMLMLGLQNIDPEQLSNVIHNMSVLLTLLIEKEPPFTVHLMLRYIVESYCWFCGSDEAYVELAIGFVGSLNELVASSPLLYVRLYVLGMF